MHKPPEYFYLVLLNSLPRLYMIEKLLKKQFGYKQPTKGGNGKLGIYELDASVKNVSLICYKIFYDRKQKPTV